MKKGTFTTTLLFSALFFGAASASAQGIINTIAGNGVAGFLGDGLPAISAQFRNPMGVASNSAGDVFIADKGNSRVRMISGTTGLMDTYVGTGVFGLAGLGGPASAMNIRYPDAVSVTPMGDLLVSDWYNDMVFDVDRHSHHNHHHHGDGHQGNDDNRPSYLGRLEIPAGAVANQSGYVFIADNGNNKVRYVTPDDGTPTGLMIHTLANISGAFGYSGDGGPATSATFQHVTGIAFSYFDEGSVFVSDQGNNVIRKINVITGIISTVVGTGAAGYSGDGGAANMARLNNPGALFVDLSNNLYICDRGNNVIRKVDLGSNTITTIAGNGTPGFSGDGMLSTHAQLNDPEGVCVDILGRVYIADMNNQRIRMITPTPPGPTASDPGSVGLATTATYSVPTNATATSGTPTGNVVRSATSSTLDLDNLQAGEARIFPNPSNGIFILRTGTKLTDGSLLIFNAVGQQVYNATVSGTQVQLNLTGLPAGNYNVVLRSEPVNLTQKITIEK